MNQKFIERLLEAFHLNWNTKEAPRYEYHARRMEHDHKVWKVVELTMLGTATMKSKDLAVGLKRNRAQALVKLMRSNQDHDKA